MKYNYKIEFDLEKDIWNWYDATRHPSFEGLYWRDRVKDGFQKEFDKITKLPAGEAKIETRKFVKKLHEDKAGEYNSLKWWIENEFEKKFDYACNWLEKTTGRSLACKDFTIWLTTFPRATYSLEKSEMFYSIYWVRPIENFLHEVLHFQLHRYWRENSKSPVSKLSEDYWEFLKESLTIIIDDDVRPLINFTDNGYLAHQEFRKLLHRQWQKCHDFNKLINFGLKNLPSFMMK